MLTQVPGDKFYAMMHSTVLHKTHVSDIGKFMARLYNFFQSIGFVTVLRES